MVKADENMCSGSRSNPGVWVDLELRHDRLYGTVVGTGLRVSARSMSTLRLKLLEALARENPDLAHVPHIYWRHHGHEISFSGGAAQWPFYRQVDADRKLQDLRPPLEQDGDGLGEDHAVG